jgi:hypothetical protein
MRQRFKKDEEVCEICGETEEHKDGEIKERVLKPSELAKDDSKAVYKSHGFCFRNIKRKSKIRH